jgi:hypothetical protein
VEEEEVLQVQKEVVHQVVQELSYFVCQHHFIQEQLQVHPLLEQMAQVQF